MSDAEANRLFANIISGGNKQCRNRESRGEAGIVVVAIALTALCSCETNTTDPNGTTGTFTTGATLDPERFAELPQAINPFAASSNEDLPSSADVLKNLPPIGDQGQMGSCTAWASGYAGATATANRSYQWGPDSAAHQGSPRLPLHQTGRKRMRTRAPLAERAH